MQSLTAIPISGNRLPGWLAVTSGVFGIAAFACLIVFLVMRPSDPQTSRLLLRSHDAGVIVQSLCLMPFALALGTIARQHSPGSSRVMGVAAVTFLTLVVILMVLSFFHVVADVLYMIPQGAVGGWLIAVCRQHANGLPKGLRRLGIVAGVGLILISVFPIGYALFVDPAILHGPISDDDPTPPGTERANGIVHLVLAIGTLIGCSMYPLWSALAGRWLLLRGDR
ncbi:hypothetical protein [Luteibacter sp. dw_328]|uniref:hypothetical protein n=1 Tax=Luteibacter sp. dw_328 TaxID=2719796 RepID=UPI001BD1FBDC|nr:hypothetical protein [Luteibacter sp. dw_328]